MFLTDLIKLHSVKAFISEYFPPKPAVRRSTSVRNRNPSLTGKAFEIFFKIVHGKKQKLEDILNEEIRLAEKSVGRLIKSLSKPTVNIGGNSAETDPT